MKYFDTTIVLSSWAKKQGAAIMMCALLLMAVHQQSFGQWMQSSGYNAAPMRGFFGYSQYMLVDEEVMGISPQNIDSLYGSTDNGQTWVAFAPNGGIPLAATLNGITPTLFGTASYPSGGGSLTGVLSFSTNFGKTWSPDTTKFPSNNSTNHLAGALCTLGTTVYAADGPFGIYKQTPPYSSWTPDTVGLTKNDTPYSVSAMIVSGNNIIASTFGGGVVTSSLQNPAWTPINSGLNSPVPGWAGPGVVAFALSGSSVFAMVPRNGFFFDSLYYFYRTTNNGSSWTQMNANPLNLGIGVGRFAASNSSLFAASDSVVYVSNDNGATWFQANQGLPSLGSNGNTITIIQVSGGNLIIGILGNDQIWYRKLSDFVGSSVGGDKSLAPTLSLSESFPNPMNSTATIKYSLPGSSAASLKMYDVTGKEIAVLAEGYQSGGSHEAEIDGSTLPSGVYFYRLTAAGQSAGHWLQLIR